MENNYNIRPKINSKIIFYHLLPDTKHTLLIGNNNDDILEILKQKKISCVEFKSLDEKSIIDFLEKQKDKGFDCIILNLELCNYHKLKLILSLLVEKSKYSLIRFRNHNISDKKVTKRKRIKKIIYKERISVIKRFYGKRNFICNCLLFKFFSYYTVYFIKRNEIRLNYELSLSEKVRKFIFSFRKEALKLIINKNK